MNDKKMRRAPNTDEVEQLMLNAQLRDELEPFVDESIDLVNIRRMSTPEENEYLASLLAWERAPVLPIRKWFEPELTLVPPDQLSEELLHDELWKVIHLLYENKIVLEFTEHLSDRELYCVLFRDILPAHEKKIDLPRNFLHFHCIDDNNEPEIWLRYYATEEERTAWAEQSGEKLPMAEPLPYPRKMPRRPNSSK